MHSCLLMRYALPLVMLALAGCGAQLGDPPPTVNGTPGKGDGPGDPGSGGGGGTGSGGTGSGSAGNAPVSATQYLAGLSMLDCNEAYTCMSSFPTNTGSSFSDVYGTSLQVCYALLLEDFAPATVEAEIVQGRVKFDGQSAADCLAQLTFGSCTDYFANGPHWAAPCYKMFTPEVMQGGACEIDASCTTGHCDPTTLTCT